MHDVYAVEVRSYVATYVHDVMFFGAYWLMMSKILSIIGCTQSAYTVTLTPSVGSDGEQITNEVITVNTTQSSIVVGGLDVNVEYMLTVAVKTTAGQIAN